MTVDEFIEKEGLTINALASELGVHRLTIYQRQNSGWHINWHILDGKKLLGWTKPNGGIWFD